jgi:hypothetical protein
MNSTLALQIITTIGYYRDNHSSAPYNIREIWWRVFNRDLPLVHQRTFGGDESWVNWDKAKRELYEAAINYIADKLNKIN